MDPLRRSRGQRLRHEVVPGVGLVLWFVNRAIVGKPDEVDAERIDAG